MVDESSGLSVGACVVPRVKVESPAIDFVACVGAMRLVNRLRAVELEDLEDAPWGSWCRTCRRRQCTEGRRHVRRGWTALAEVPGACALQLHAFAFARALMAAMACCRSDCSLAFSAVRRSRRASMAVPAAGATCCTACVGPSAAAAALAAARATIAGWHAIARLWLAPGRGVVYGCGSGELGRGVW